MKLALRNNYCSEGGSIESFLLFIHLFCFVFLFFFFFFSFFFLFLFLSRDKERDGFLLKHHKVGKDPYRESNRVITKCT